MNINRKYIIIFGILILLLVFIAVAISYYKEKGRQVLIPIPEEKLYLIWCYQDGVSYDCSDRTFFQPGEPVSISVNLEKEENFLYDPCFLCYYSDISGSNGKIGRRCLPDFITLPEGFRLEKGTTIPEDKKVFTLLKISVYPDDSFKESDESVILDLEGILKDFTGTLNN